MFEIEKEITEGNRTEKVKIRFDPSMFAPLAGSAPPAEIAEGETPALPDGGVIEKPQETTGDQDEKEAVIPLPDGRTIEVDGLTVAATDIEPEAPPAPKRYKVGGKKLRKVEEKKKKANPTKKGGGKNPSRLSICSNPECAVPVHWKQTIKVDGKRYCKKCARGA